MAYRIKATFAEGVTLDQLDAARQSAGLSPDTPAPGNISHEETTEGGRVVFLDEWESKAAFDTFVSQTAGPMMRQAGIAPPEVEEL